MERDTFGACNNPNYHGHNYELDISVEGEIDPDTGYVIDVDILKQLAEDRRLGSSITATSISTCAWFRERHSHPPRTSPSSAGNSSRRGSRGWRWCDPSLGNPEELCGL